ncbi:hypothetical protein CU669_08225 [Paramagnetospirillum kuznetsovii]|uniref:Iron-containing redox enzyme family protein n=1 Tax=Paramagnetospirillum kuznetsovii TaxID=2053833 RepID=A0A364P024_9PROT|nr:iron-containing redox enzyme family protein [Paramagnetospirillum kuznetsovii]RAU22653.1 hypothetical protein CU669_08225 [Paramagnetospirillum kuznetsovii]
MLIDEHGSVPADIHPLPDLLRRDGAAVLAAFIDNQRRDFVQVLSGLSAPGSGLRETLSDLNALGAADQTRLHDLFLDLHRHVMAHPVWLHPFFLRVFEGRITPAQVKVFATQYFNQIKNTRQCVALAIGRFHGLSALSGSHRGQRLSELTQIALAQLVADEYGVGSHGLDDYPELGRLLASKTHMVMYRQLFDGLGIPAEAQDVPMIPEVADNVLIQRLVAGHPAFSPLEALASVGLGMEWGVPEFFSLLLGGLIRVSERDGLGLTPRHLEVFIAHVRYDVLHAISVMLVTSLHMGGDHDRQVVKNACNMLMAGRTAMMGGLYRTVFEEACPDVVLAPPYGVSDPRIVQALLEARASIAPECVVGGNAYGRSTTTPFT